MPLMDHVGELRRRMTIMIVSVLIAALVIYYATPTLIEIMMDPIRSALPEDTPLTILTVLGGFTIRFKVAVFFGMVVCTPILIWEVMGFFLPALKESERRWVVPTVAAMVFLFFFGMVFCYLIIQRAAFGWLLSQTIEGNLAIVADAEDYLNIMMLLEIGFGFAFQLPLIIFYLSIFHIVPYKTFREQWRTIYVGLLVVVAIITPDASPVTMLLMFAALIVLYEVALAIARSVLVARNGRESLKWTRAEYEERVLDAE